MKTRYIIKRDGTRAKFETQKIFDAVFKAALSVYNKEIDAEEIASISASEITDMVEQMDIDEVHIERIQDICEEYLAQKFTKVGIKFIRYRERRKEARKGASAIYSDYSEYQKYTSGVHEGQRENANMGEKSLQGYNCIVAGNASKHLWLNSIYNEEVAELHKSGYYHIHDLSMISAYCSGWDIDDILLKGFGGVRNTQSFSPPKHFSSALGQIVNFFYTLQGENAGAQALSGIDRALAPFVAFDKLTYEQVKQKMQEFVCNMNIKTRVGFQTPFTNITMDLVVQENVKNTPIIYGGEYHRSLTYGDFQEQMDMINKAYLEVMIEGDSNGRAYSFPIPTYNITKEFDWDSEIADLIAEVTVKYGVPYFCNFINSDMKPEDVRSMCCRLRIDNSELIRRGGGLFGSNPLTGSIGVVTINAPRIGYIHKGNFDGMMKNLDYLMWHAKESLLVKKKTIEANTEKGMYPFCRVYLQGVKERTGKYWDNHFMTIGVVGVNEMVRNFTNDRFSIADPEGTLIAEAFLDRMNDNLRKYQEESGKLFNLEATPAENTCYELAKKDKKEFEDIITAGSNKNPYYTNSSQLPVGYTSNVFDAMDIQDRLQTKYTGGTVFHVYNKDKISDPKIVKRLLYKLLYNYRTPYFSFTPTFSICPEHGYILGEVRKCEKCGSETEIWSRVTGFLRPVENWNDGKREEFRERKEYKISPAAKEVVREA